MYLIFKIYKTLNYLTCSHSTNMRLISFLYAIRCSSYFLFLHFKCYSILSKRDHIVYIFLFLSFIIIVFTNILHHPTHRILYESYINKSSEKRQKKSSKLKKHNWCNSNLVQYDSIVRKFQLSVV